MVEKDYDCEVEEELCGAIDSLEMSPMIASGASLADEMCKEEAFEMPQSHQLENMMEESRAQDDLF
jgi:hypothetical protein